MSLLELVRQWTRNNNECLQRWCEELHRNDIFDIQVLQKVARGNRWENFLEKINSDALVECLRDWKSDKKHSESKL